MQNKLLKRLLMLGGVMTMTSGLTGCAYFNVGEEEFSCSGMPGSVYCHSTRDVYESTNDGAVPSPMDKDGAYNEECEDCVKSSMDGGPAVTTVEDARGGGAAAGTSGEGATRLAASDEVIDNYVTPALPERPVPIRTPSQVMRIWVAPYIDSNGDYNAPGYVYTEIEPRRWVLAKEYEEASRVFQPLEKKDMKTESSGSATDREGVNTLEELKAKTQAKAYK
jgi:conjugal transfer pilus assembly protein TraV